jgi:N4-gp56 family major capsid protein
MTDFRKYGDGSNSSIGEQIVTEAYIRKAITDMMRDQYFQPLATVKDMPKNSGKTMKANVYVPILDDRNISDEGIDAVGNLLNASRFYAFVNGAVASIGWTGASPDGSYASRAAVIAADEYDGEVVTSGAANLYGSSRDAGTIVAKLPVLAEGAARVNRVGATRLVIEGTLEQMGFFNEYTEESVNFDTDSELQQHIITEMMNAASEITEDVLQKDLLNSPGIVRYAGTATDMDEVDDTDLTYGDFIRLGIALDLSRTPKHTTVVTGSRMIDTKTINAARVMFVSPEMEVALDSLTDFQGDKALIRVRHYAGNTTTMNGEIGTIHNFRIVVVPEMQVYHGAGADASAIDGYYETDDAFDVHPLLVVGDDSFSTIGFMSDGKAPNTKFTIHHMKPGGDSVTRENPFGNMGLMSIRWWYGFLLKRPERIAVMYTAALM